MCKILSVTTVNQKKVLNCSDYEGVFLGSRILRIQSGGEQFETTDFILDKAPSCFSSHHAPWIMLTGAVDDKFLRTGNEIQLC